LKSIKAPAENPTKVTVITRPHQDDKKASKSIQESLEILRNSGIDVITKSSIHQKFCIIDHKVVWYGSINLLGYGNSEESMMRLVSSGIAFELTNSISI
jgi:phosphatidylserine/phosphatidylglycerophosphate/cardiolipin synthase-like enzyme